MSNNQRPPASDLSVPTDHPNLHEVGEKVRILTANFLDRAQEPDGNGRHSELVVKDNPLRQMIISLRKGEELSEHNAPPAASIFVLHGKLRVTAQDEAEIREGEIESLTHYRHGVLALEDTVFLLTTVTNLPGESSHSAVRE